MTGLVSTLALLVTGCPFRGPWGVSYSANLTSHRETGIGAWPDGRIIASLHGAEQGGGRVLPPMPAAHYAQGIDHEDMMALLAQLRSLPPVEPRVPAPIRAAAAGRRA